VPPAPYAAKPSLGQFKEQLRHLINPLDPRVLTPRTIGLEAAR
jgi:hypothetical protein